MRKVISIVATTIAALFLFSACAEEVPTNGQKTEDKNRQSNYDRLVQNQPAHTMDYSPTRETKNFWIDTWNQKGKLAYTYLMNANGDVFGYFITVGPPVSYCTSLVVPYQLKDTKGDGFGPNIVVPGPSVDGTFSSGSNCDRYYGKDAVSGAYIDFTAGMGINALTFDQPLPQYGDAKPLGKATVAEAKNK